MSAEAVVKQNIQLTIAGPSEDENYWQQCKNVIENLPKNITVNYIGEITPQQVMPLIKEHHLYCLPTQGENFGHSIFEAFMIGRPVLISNKTPWLKLNQKQAGWEVDITTQNCLVTYIEQAAMWQQQEFDIYCKTNKFFISTILAINTSFNSPSTLFIVVNIG